MKRVTVDLQDAPARVNQEDLHREICTAANIRMADLLMVRVKDESSDKLIIEVADGVTLPNIQALVTAHQPTTTDDEAAATAKAQARDSQLQQSQFIQSLISRIEALENGRTKG